MRESKQLTKLFAEEVSSPVNSGLDRSRWETKNLRDLLVTLLFEITKNKRCPILLR